MTEIASARQPNLGRLHRVDLRTAWQNEAGSFTPWLAQHQNLSLLGEAIGIDLELEAQEQNVGPFRADILCKDTSSNCWVLVENQLERTDHSHLGQLLTYAAGLEAVTIVWIAATFTDEHRAALDWLNSKTEESVNFFGLEIELWQVGDSIPAPKFNVVARPNEWTRTVAAAATAGSATTGQFQLEYWKALCAFLREHNSILSSAKPYPQHWLYFGLGRPSCKLSAFFRVSKDELGVMVTLFGRHRHTIFRELYRQRGAIEAELGMQLHWDLRENKTESQIAVPLHRADPKDRADWPRQHAWFMTTLSRLGEVFGPRLQAISTVDGLNGSPEPDAVALNTTT